MKNEHKEGKSFYGNKLSSRGEKQEPNKENLSARSNKWRLESAQGLPGSGFSAKTLFFHGNECLAAQGLTSQTPALWWSKTPKTNVMMASGVGYTEGRRCSSEKKQANSVRLVRRRKSSWIGKVAPPQFFHHGAFVEHPLCVLCCLDCGGVQWRLGWGRS